MDCQRTPRVSRKCLICPWQVSRTKLEKTISNLPVSMALASSMISNFSGRVVSLFDSDCSCYYCYCLGDVLASFLRWFFDITISMPSSSSGWLLIIVLTGSAA